MPTEQTKRRVHQTYSVAHSPDDSEPRAPSPSSVNITSDSLQVASVSESSAQCEGVTHDSGTNNFTPHHKHQGADQCNRSEKLYVQQTTHLRRKTENLKLILFADTIPLRSVRTRPTQRSRATKSNQWRQIICRSLSHPLPTICRYLPPYDADDCRNVLRFVAVATHKITSRINSVTFLPDSPTTP